MKRIVPFVLLFFLFPLPTFCQTTLSGKIINENSAPLVGANVTIANSYNGAVTNTNGEFELNNIKDDNFVLEVSYLGYRDTNIVVNLQETSYLTIKLLPRKYLSDDIVVTSTRAGNKYPISYSEISKNELNRINTGDDITYLLSITPSVVTTSETGTGVGYTAMRIRGAEQSRINVSVNGVPLNDAESQGVFWVNMPDFASSVDNVQIQRGVGTSSNGAGAFGATVNFKTQDTEAKPFAEYQVLGGSYATLRNTVKLGSGIIGNHFSFEGRYSTLSSNGYVNNAFVDHVSGYFAASYRDKNRIAKFTYIDGNQRTGISWWGVPADSLETNRTFNPAGYYLNSEGKKRYYKDQTDNYRQTHYQLHYSQQISSTLTATAALHYTKGAGYYEQYQDDVNWLHTTEFSAYGLDEMVVVNGDSLYGSDLIRQKWLTNDFYGFVSSINYKSGDLSASVGGGYNLYDGDHFGDILWIENNANIEKNYRWYFNNGKKTDYNIYSKLNYQILTGLNGFIDLQYRNIDYKMGGIDDNLDSLNQHHTYHFFNPKGGLFYDINRNKKVYASVGVANREPTRANFKDANLDPSSTPKPERLYDFELGLRMRYTQVSLNANLYYMHYKDQLVPTGQKSNVGYDIMTNVDVSYRRGIELEGIWKINSYANWQLNLTLSENKIKNYAQNEAHYSQWNELIYWYDSLDYVLNEIGETDIAYSPSIIASNNFILYPAKGLAVNIITKYIGKQFFDNTSSDERSISAYLVQDLRVIYDLPVKKYAKEINISLQVNNLFNTLYVSNAYGGYEYYDGVETTWSYYYPMAGMHFYLGAAFKF